MKRVCVIRQGFHPLDTRVRRELQALTSAGHEVDLICVRRPGQPLARAARPAHGLPAAAPAAARRRAAAATCCSTASSALAAAALCTALHLRRRWDVVQVNSMPDALVFAAAVPRMLGARVLLDLHECMPEFFAVKYGVAAEPPGAAAARRGRAGQHPLRRPGRSPARQQMREAFVRRGADPDKIDGGPELLRRGGSSTPRGTGRPRRRPDRFTVICHGAIEASYGLDTLVRAVALLRDEVPGLRLEIFGEGTYRPRARSGSPPSSG